MPSPADVPISALRSGSDELAAHVRALTPDQLTGPSGASEWTIAQVLSHLGSGAEIGQAGLEAALGTADAPPADFNRNVWARWDAMTPEDQAAGFLTANESFVAYYEAIDDATRSTASVDFRRLPEPVDVATHASFRLNELTLHSWDVRVAQDPQAALAPEAVASLLGVLPYLMGWLGKPAPVLDGRSLVVGVHTSAPDTDFGLNITDTVTLIDPPTEPDATLVLPTESWLRLASGRLGAAVTPAGVTVTGPLTLDTLRAVFPGF
jgi:uncharacterized protein (TIGR03083 family)